MARAAYRFKLAPGALYKIVTSLLGTFLERTWAFAICIAAFESKHSIALPVLFDIRSYKNVYDILLRIQPERRIMEIYSIQPCVALRRFCDGPAYRLYILRRPHHNRGTALALCTGARRRATLPWHVRAHRPLRRVRGVPKRKWLCSGRQQPPGPRRNR